MVPCDIKQQGFVSLENKSGGGDYAYHANQEFESTQCFKQGDHVSFTLDCDHSVLEYFINGTKIKDLTFGGNLAKYKSTSLSSIWQWLEFIITNDNHIH